MIKDGLVFWNPWWNNDTERIKDVKERMSLEDIKPLFDRKEVLAITGARRSGKTSSMYLLIRELLEQGRAQNILYINLEDPTFEEASLEGIYEAYSELMLPRGRIYLFLDEIQNMEKWEKWIKKMYDSLEEIKIVISGSNSSLLKTEYSTYLAGRNLTHELFPLSFKEFTGFRDLEIKTESELLARKARLKHLLEEYMRFGGFPEVALEKKTDMKYILLKEYFSAILARDILTRYNIKERKKLERLAVYMITNVSNMVSAKSMSKIFDLNIRTVSEYLDHLEDAYMLFFVNHFSYSLKQQYTYPRKVYCVDTGMRNAVSFSFSRDTGRLMENIVYLKLRKTGDIYYWRDRGADVDFVVKRGTKVVNIIQTCYDLSDEKTRKREKFSLLKALRHFHLKKGTVISWDKEDKEREDGMTVEYRPLWKWLLE